MANENPKLEFCRRFVCLERGQPIRFEGRHYLDDIYRVDRRNLVLRCSRQTEKSTFLANTILYECCTRPGIRIVFVCPRLEQAQVFSRSRLLQIIERSPYVRRTLLRPNQHAPVMNMDFRNGSSVHIRAAFNSADACRGLSADLLVVDEFQDLAAGDLPVLSELLSHSADGRTILAGTPKDIGNHLQAMFSRSTANEWLVPCPGCGRNVTLDERCLGPQAVICSTCQHSIDPRGGAWVPRNPAATWGMGYWINHLLVPWVRYQDILDRQLTYDLVLMKNEVLGLPTTTGDFVVTRGQLEACCQDCPQANSWDDIPLAGRRQLILGLDWGGGGASRTVLTLGFMRSDFCFQICRLERFDSRDDPNYVLDQVASRCRQFQVAMIAADGGGNGTTLNRLLVDRLGNNPDLLYGIVYSHTDHEPQRDGVVTRWTVHRTMSIGTLFAHVKKQSLHFPRLADCDRFLDDFSAKSQNTTTITGKSAIPIRPTSRTMPCTAPTMRSW